MTEAYKLSLCNRDKQDEKTIPDLRYRYFRVRSFISSETGRGFG